MKLINKCSGACSVCLFRRVECNPEDGKIKFARAGKEELIRRLSDDNYTDKEKQAINVWLKIQHGVTL